VRHGYLTIGYTVEPYI